MADHFDPEVDADPVSTPLIPKKQPRECECRDDWPAGLVHRFRTTGKRELCYQFHAKHHDYKNIAESQWLPPDSLTRDQEFSIFDTADQHDIADEDGNLYGVLVADGRPMEIGTCGQTTAKFWQEEQSRPWHGHPVWPIETRDKRLGRPVPKIALEQMRKAGLLKPSQFRRLTKGK